MDSHSHIIAWFLLFLSLSHTHTHTITIFSLFFCTDSLKFLLHFIFRGSGEDGQLGIGSNEEKEWVCLVKALQPHRIRSVVAGSRNSLAIADDGKVSSFFFLLFFLFNSFLKIVGIAQNLIFFLVGWWLFFAVVHLGLEPKGHTWAPCWDQVWEQDWEHSQPGQGSFQC